MVYDGPTEFVPHHVHSIFSPLDGVLTQAELFRTCKERGWPAAAVTEHGNLASVPDNYFAAKENGIKYIMAIEAYFNDYEPERRKMVDEGVKVNDLKVSNPDLHRRIMRNRHLTILAMNNIGCTNLIKLMTQAYETGFYYRPRIWFDKLLEYSEGLIVLSGCLNGPVSHELRNKNLRSDDKRGALDYIEKFKDAFGDRYYIELQMPCLTDFDDTAVFAMLAALSRRYNIPAVITNDSHYLTRRDYAVQKVMMAIDQGLTVDSPDLFHVNSDEQYLKTRAELYETFKTRKYSQFASDIEFNQYCDNTLLIAERCNNYKPDTSPKVPNLPNARETLTKIVESELKRRGMWDNPTKFVIDNKEVTYKEQAAIELARFISKDFESYFLITRDLIKYSHDNGWPTGPRGSASGSLVCYLLNISSQDPCVWGLSFDRFLSRARGGMMLKITAE